MKRKIYILAVFLSVALSGMGQSNETVQAATLYNQGKYAEAIELINKAVGSELGKSDAQTWHIRGLVYQGMYKTTELGVYNSNFREEGLNSVYKSVELDTAKVYFENNRKLIHYYANSYFNDAAKTLDTIKYGASIDLYEKFKSIMLSIYPNFNFDKRAIQYYGVLGSKVYTRLLENTKGETRKKHFDKAVEAFEYVLKIDSIDYGANYNLGVLYFNKAVDRIKNLDPEASIIVINIKQDENIDIFNDALPYLHMADDIRPNRAEVLFALAGIYFYLNDFEKSDQYHDQYKRIAGIED